MPEPLRECRERASHVISWARLSPADLRITGKSVRVALPFPLMDRQDRTCVRGGRVEGKAMGAVTAVADPVVACAGELRGHPGPRSAAVLSAWTSQPGEPPEPPVGPLDEVVDVVTAAQRLPGWAIWCQLAAAARLLLALRKRSPLGSESHDGCDEVDRELAKRLDRVAEREQRSVRIRKLDHEELAVDFVSLELSLACGLTRSAASHRVLVAQSLIVDGRLPRVAMLARAGLVEWGKL